VYHYDVGSYMKENNGGMQLTQDINSLLKIFLPLITKTSVCWYKKVWVYVLQRERTRER